MSHLDDEVRRARELGFPSYGKYKAAFYNPTPPAQTPSKTRRKPHRDRKFTDGQAFQLWQQGMTDTQIGQTLGVSRAYIQRWRDQLELPSTARFPVNAQKYRLSYMEDGTAIVINDEL